MMQLESNGYINVSALRLGDFTGSPTDILSWITTDENNTYPLTVWGLTNETPAFYYSPEELRKIISIALAIRYYYAPLLIAFGCVANILTILTIVMTKLIKLPTMHFIIGIASIDLCFLVALLLWWSGSFSAVLTTFPGWCQLVTFISHLSSFTSVWLHCSLTVERYISTARGQCVNLWFSWCNGNKHCEIPQQSCTITCSTLKVKAYILTIFIIGVVVYVNLSLTVDYVFIGKVAVCVPIQNLFPYLQVLNKIDIFLNVLLPYSVILCLTIGTMWIFIKNYHKKNIVITRNCIERANMFLRKKSEIHLTVATIVFCIIFLCLTSPSQVLRVIYLFPDTTSVRSHISLSEYLMQQIFQAAYYTKFAVNLPIMLIFHKGFRTAFKLLMWRVQLKCKGIFQKNRTPVTTNTLQFTVEFSSTLIKLHETSLL